MRRVTLCCCAMIIVACTKSETPPPDSTAGASFAGTWQVRGFNEAGDSIVGYQLALTADTSAWTITLPNRPALPLRVVALAGDSVVTEAGPYESVLRPGVQVRTTAVLRLQGDTLVGSTVARYTTTGPDSVLLVRSKGTRVP